MQSIIVVIHLLVSVALIGLILIQRGKGADIGAAFGSGASQTVFGSSGSASFLSRTTAILATVFFVTSLSLAYFHIQARQGGSVTESAPPVETVMPAEEPVPDQAPADVPAVPE